MVDRWALESERSARAWRRHLSRDVDIAALRADLTAGTLPLSLEALGEDRPDCVPLRIDHTSWSARELAERASSLASALSAEGVRAGDRVLLVAPTCSALVLAYLGVLRSGATVVLAGPHLTGPELADILRRSGAKVALVDASVRDSLTSLVQRDGASLIVAAIDEFVARDVSGPSIAVPADPQAVALLAFTSGTTGDPKAVPLTHANLMSSVRGVMWSWDWSRDDVLLHALPLYHQHGLSGVHIALLSGSRTVVHSKFSEQEYLAAIPGEGATVLFGVPAIYRRLVDADQAADVDLSSLRLVVSGSAPLSVELGDRLRNLIGHAPLERYGTTESGLDVSNPYRTERKLGTVGLPLPGVELAIVDPQGDPVPSGGQGEIWVRGPQIFGGYEGGGDNGEITSDGWFRTGDLGEVDPEEGFVTITGRLKQLIITGGLNVSPREVERVLERQPGVDAVAVVGLPSEKWGEEVVAFVVPSLDAEADEDALIAGARAELAAHKCPKRVFYIDALPMNAMGKVARADLVKFAAATEHWQAVARGAVSRLSVLGRESTPEST